MGSHARCQELPDTELPDTPQLRPFFQILKTSAQNGSKSGPGSAINFTCFATGQRTRSAAVKNRRFVGILPGYFIPPGWHGRAPSRPSSMIWKWPDSPQSRVQRQNRPQMCRNVTGCNGSESRKWFIINRCNGVTGVPHFTLPLPTVAAPSNPSE